MEETLCERHVMFRDVYRSSGEPGEITVMEKEALAGNTTVLPRKG